MLQAAVGVTVSSDNGGISNHKRGNMGQRIKVFSTIPISDPETFLASSLEYGIISLTLGSKSIQALKTKAFSINGHAVIGGNRFVLGTAAILFPVAPVFMITWAAAGL